MVRIKQKNILATILVGWLQSAWGIDVCLLPDGTKEFSSRGCSSEAMVMEPYNVGVSETSKARSNTDSECKRMIEELSDVPNSTFCGDDERCHKRVARAFKAQKAMDLRKSSGWRNHNCAALGYAATP